MPARTAARKPASKKPVTDEVVYGEKIDGHLSGNLTFDPELRFTATGRAVATLNIAVNGRELNEETGEWEELETVFYRVTVWAQMGERCAENLSRGDRIVATGYYQDRTYTNREGDRVTVTEFTANDIGASMLFKDVKISRPARRSSKPSDDTEVPF